MSSAQAAAVQSTFLKRFRGAIVLDSELLYGGTSEVDLLLQALQRFPERIAFQHGDKQSTYADLQRDISRYSQALAQAGIGKGSRVGILSGNRAEVIYLNFALGILGCCLVPMHPKGSLRDHIYIVNDAQLNALVIDADSYGERGIELQAAGVPLVLSLGAHATFTNLIALADGFIPSKLTPPDVHASDICRLSYSGGTTGEPKAIVGTYGMLQAKTMIQLIEWEWPREIRQLIIAPLSHAGGSMVLVTLILGGTLFVLPGFDAVSVMQHVERHRINCALMVPTMIATLLDHADIDSYDLKSLETIFYGASPMPPARLRQGIARFGKIFFQFYGQTEAPTTVSVLRKDEHDVDDPLRLASCGRPVPWLRVALLDDNGSEVADGTPGEICVRGPLVMHGYWNKPEQTREAMAGGWLHSGDMAIRDADGFLRIVDRKKDMIITGGFNVFASEVEAVITEQSAVAGCAVFGIPDERWGEAVVAAVAMKSGQRIAAETLIALVKEAKGPVQAPKKIIFVDQIPLTQFGKPDKKALRAQYGGAQATTA
jgi:fatty-acyl-CoA synthase